MSPSEGTTYYGPFSDSKEACGWASEQGFEYGFRVRDGQYMTHLIRDRELVESNPNLNYQYAIVNPVNKARVSFGFKFYAGEEGETILEQILTEIQATNTVLEYWEGYWLAFGEVPETVELEKLSAKYGFSYWLN